MGIRISPENVMYILRNITYSGNLLLQKTYTDNHINKQKKQNRGELPMYHVTDSHMPLIDSKTFNQVQEEAKRRVEYFHPSHEPPPRHLFTGLIRCGMCGAVYRRRIAGAAKQYKKPVWICHTFNTMGKAACASQQIPETILIEKTAETLNIQTLDDKTLHKQIKEIQVPAHNRLVFVFHDGTTKETAWENPSRRDSWTPEMKEKARQQTRERLSKH